MPAQPMVPISNPHCKVYTCTHPGVGTWIIHVQHACIINFDVCIIHFEHDFKHDTGLYWSGMCRHNQWRLQLIDCPGIFLDRQDAVVLSQSYNNTHTKKYFNYVNLPRQSINLGSQYSNADLTQQFIRKFEISSILCLTCVCINSM